jgi:hypothetical protein
MDKDCLIDVYNGYFCLDDFIKSDLQWTELIINWKLVRLTKRGDKIEVQIFKDAGETVKFICGKEDVIWRLSDSINNTDKCKIQLS